MGLLKGLLKGLPRLLTQLLSRGKLQHVTVKCRLMELPSPDVDELGRPWWSGTSADVSKAYRRLSILVHPARHHLDFCVRVSYTSEEA